MNRRGSRSREREMTAPVVVEFRKALKQLAEMVEISDNGDAPQPLLFEREDHPLRDGNRPMFADGTEAGLDSPFLKQLSKGAAGKDPFLVANHVLGGAVTAERAFQALGDPAAIGSFQCRVATTWRE